MQNGRVGPEDLRKVDWSRPAPLLALATCLLLFNLLSAAQAQDPTSLVLPGLKLSLHPLDVAGPGDSRVSRLAAMYVPEGTPFSPFHPPGPFRATWHGFLDVDLNEEYQFAARSSGSFALSINGQSVLQASGARHSARSELPTRLHQGLNEIHLAFESPPQGDAWIRLYWQNSTLTEEPIPPEVLNHRPDKELDRGRQRRLGKQLFVEGRCIRCHQGQWNSAHWDRPAPSLEQLNERYRPSWVIEWLLQTDAANTRMPNLLHGTATERRQQAADLTAWLFKTPPPTPASTLPANPLLAMLGQELFQTLGCQACHLIEPGDSPSHERSSLQHLATKRSLPGLIAFLEDPDRWNPWTRMPDFGLNHQEAMALSAYLWPTNASAKPSTLPEDQPSPIHEGDPERGRALAAQLGCAQCHALPETLDRSPAPSFKSWPKDLSSLPGCLSQAASGTHPLYRFDQTERTALLAFLQNDLDSLDHRVAAEAAEDAIQSLHCIACHRRDGQSDVWAMISETAGHNTGLANQNAPPEDSLEQFFNEEESSAEETNIHASRPPLTWAGEKLHATWIESLLAGSLGYKPRPHLKARMPVFKAYAQDLAVGLAHQHGFGATSPPEPTKNSSTHEERIQIGRALIQMDHLGCRSCHAVGDQPALSGTSSEAINFRYTGQRLRKHYYDRFVRNPQRIWPGTMMPRFVDEAGNTPLKSIYGGDGRGQFEAIWEYILGVSASGE